MGLIFDLLLNTTDYIGKKGERLTARKLGWINIFGYKGKVLQNVYIPKDNGETSEIDLLFITQVGIFVIESKNYSGYIFGTDTNKTWTTVLYAGKGFFGRSLTEKHKFYNPIMQNKTHIKWLKNYLKRDTRFFSLIVFSERCELKKIDLSSSPDEVFVCNRDVMPRIIKKCFADYSNCLSDYEIENIYNELAPLTNADNAIKRKHKQDVIDKKNGLICPYCGGKLVLRTAKKGNNAGNEFYGCSNFPKCRYTKKVNTL